MGGWVKVDRAIQEHWLWSEKPFSKAQAWIDLILCANHKEAKIMIKHRLIEIKRGQQARSEITLSKEWGWSRDKVRRFLKLLESDGMVIQQKTNVTTLLTICNYDGFQSTATPDNTADDTAGNTPDDTPAIQQSIHKQECNKNKKVKNKDLSSGDDHNKPVINCPHDEIVKLYMKILPELPGVKVITEERKRALRATWRSHKNFQTLEFWEMYFNQVKNVDWIMGRTGTTYAIDFTYLVKQKNVLGIVEGKH